MENVFEDSILKIEILEFCLRMVFWKIEILKNYSRLKFWKFKFKKKRILEKWNLISEDERIKNGIFGIACQRWPCMSGDGGGEVASRNSIT